MNKVVNDGSVVFIVEKALVKSAPVLDISSISGEVFLS